MDRSYYLNLNQQFQDTKLSSLNKLEKIKEYLSLIDEYKNQNPNSNLSELNLSISNEAAMKFLSLHLDDPENKHVFIRGNNGKYLSGENGEHYMKCDRSFPLGWEKFIIEDVGNGKVALKSMNKYVSSENGEGAMTCNRKNADSWEFFEMIENDDGTFAFKGSNGKFVTSENGEKPISCYAGAVRGWEKFHVQHIKSFADEIHIEYTLLNKHMINLCDNCDAAEAERANIDPEKFYYFKSVCIDHHGRGDTYTTQHVEKLIDQNDFKAAVKSADKKTVASQDALDKHVQLLNWIIIHENKKLQDITKMFNLCSPAIVQLQNILNKKKVVLDTSKITDENDYGLVY